MISIDNVQQAAKMIKGKVIKTPLVYSPSLSKMFEGEIYLKLENLQKTGSFKIRGATYTILTHKDEIGHGGVVAASAGNHAQGVALAARQALIPATIVMPEWASITKQEATRGYGGEVVIEGQSLEECIKKAEQMALEGKTFIHPFDDPDIIVGQGTIALEILEDLKETDMILVPIGGGGIISGIASTVKSIRPGVKVIGVQSAACPSAYESYRSGKITSVDSYHSIADGISVKQVGDLNFDIIRKCVDDVVLVEEDQIAAAILLLLERKKLPRDKVCSGMVMGPWAHDIIQQEFGPIPREVLVDPHYLSGHMIHVPGVPPQVIACKTPLAWRKNLDFWMIQTAQQDGVEIWDGAKAMQVNQKAGACTVTMIQGKTTQELESKFVIGADGSASAVRKSLFPLLKVQYSVPMRECYDGALDLERDYFHWFFPKCQYSSTLISDSDKTPRFY